MSTANYSRATAYRELHFSVLLWGFTGIIGRLIEIDSTLLVWYRLLFTCLTLLVLKNLFKEIKSIDRKVAIKIMGIGCLAAIHWITFYGSIQYSNVSVAVSCLATGSLFMAFLEPIFRKGKIKWLEVLIGLIVSLGIGLIFYFGAKYTVGIIMGLFSSLFAATFTLFNKIVIDKHNPPPKAMTFIELGGGWLFICLLIPVFLQFMPDANMSPTRTDIIWLIVLAAVCTALPFILSLRALTKLSAFSSVLAINMEPIYSIILALIIFKENQELGWRFYIGTAIVVFAVFLYPILNKRFYAESVA